MVPAMFRTTAVNLHLRIAVHDQNKIKINALGKTAGATL